MRTLLLLVVVSMRLPLSAAEPIPPGMINYQGYVERDGAPVTAAADMEFSVVDDFGIAVWSESRPGVAVDHGFYSIVLGTVHPLDASVFAQGPRFLQVTIDGEILPDRRLVSVPYALAAPVADGAVTTAKLADGAVTSDKLAPDARMTWRGAWLAASPYHANDLVAHDGSSWIAIGDSLGAAPGSGSAWQVFAQGGGQAQSSCTTVILSAADFRPESARDAFSLVQDAGAWRSSAAVRANDSVSAAVRLPAGAVVAAFSAFVYDNDAVAGFNANSQAALYQLRLAGSSSPMPSAVSVIALATSGNQDALQERAAQVSALPPVPAGAATWVHVRLEADASSSAVRFYGCRIDYEMPATP